MSMTDRKKNIFMYAYFSKEKSKFETFGILFFFVCLKLIKIVSKV